MNLRYTLVASLLLFCGTSQAQLTDTQINRSLCCVVQTTYFNIACGTGTGFFISKERILTAGHVANGACYVLMRDGSKVRCYVERKSNVLDWAILRAPGANGQPLKLGKSPEQGDMVWTYGNFDFDGDGVQVGVGNFQGCRDNGTRTATAQVFAGYSGGPVVAKGGKVIGITCQTRPAENYGVIYVPIESVKRAAGL
jgi:S1-C subfamily serine protease